MVVVVAGGGKVHNVVQIEHEQRKIINCAIFLCFSKRNTVYERFKERFAKMLEKRSNPKEICWCRPSSGIEIESFIS